MYQFICTLLDHFCLCSLAFPYVPLDIHCVRSLLLILFVISIFSRWFALRYINSVYVFWQFHTYRLICSVLDEYSLCSLTIPYRPVDVHFLDQYCWYCFTVPYVPVVKHCVRSIILFSTMIWIDFQCATFRMHLVFACTAAWNADRQTRSCDVIWKHQ